MAPTDNSHGQNEPNLEMSRATPADAGSTRAPASENEEPGDAENERSQNESEVDESRPASETPAGNYLQAFMMRSGRAWMPHWDNVLEPSRVSSSGSIQLLSVRQGEGVHLNERLTCDELTEVSLADVLADVESRRPESPPAVFVCDLSEWLINSLGPTFNLSPEVFAEHLVQSGYTTSSYNDADPSTWPTRFLPKQHISLRWYSPVQRKDMEPRDMSSRRRLVWKYGLEWSQPVQTRRGGKNITIKRRERLTTTTNIFRKEWPLSAGAFNQKSAEDKSSQSEYIELQQDRELESWESIPEFERIVAWEERVTFCWGKRNRGIRPIFLFDPVPLLSDTAGSDVLPFSSRLAPRKPPPVPHEGLADPDDLLKVGTYMVSCKDASSDTAAWLDYLSRQPTLAGFTDLDLQLLAVFRVVHQDTVMFLDHVARIFDQISVESMDERLMQERLGPWRTMLGRLRRELPALEKSTGQFFSFPYGNADMPRQLTTALDELQAELRAMVERCERLQESLRSEMSLLESKRGIQEAESVSRLTEMAFLFLPMTFAASLFSMQVRELADAPPPVYAFIITAVVTVTVSYGLRLVQRSTAVGDFFRKTGAQIREEQGVTTRSIPMRKVVNWLLGWLLIGVWERWGKGMIIGVIICIVVLLIAPLWTRPAMDVSFKAAIGAFLSLFLVLVLVGVFLAASPDHRISPTWRNSVSGFGSLWRDPDRGFGSSSNTRDNNDSDEVPPEETGNEAAGQQGSGSDRQV